MSDREIYNISIKIDLDKVTLLAVNLGMLSDLDEIKKDEIDKTAPVLYLLYRWRKKKQKKRDLADALRRTNLPAVAQL